MKRIISIILILSIVLSAFSISVTAISADDKITNNAEEDIYYSDLFYGYSYYLERDGYTSRTASLFLETTNNIIDEYIETPEFYTAVTMHALGIATDANERTKYITDKIGLTDFQFNKELDAANIEFVKKACNVDMSLSGEFKKFSKISKNINSVISTFKDIEKNAIEDHAIKDLKNPQIYNTYADMWFGYYEEYFTELEPQLPTFRSSLYTALSGVADLTKFLSKASGFFQALTLSLAMENADMELIQDIIDTQPKSSTLYKGMTRLKEQLRNGFVSYFADTYVKNKICDLLIDWSNLETLEKAIMGPFYGTISEIVENVNDLVLNLLKIDYEDYTAVLILRNYSNDLRNGLINKTKCFSSQFNNIQIKNYEKMYNAYLAMCSATLSLCEKLAVHNLNSDKSYCQTQEEKFKKFSYLEHIECIKKLITKISPENRIVSDFGDWNLGSVHTISNGSDIIEDGYLYCIRQGFPGNIVKSYDNPQTLKFAENQDIIINGNIAINQKNGTAAVIPVSTDLEVKGDLFFNNTYQKEAAFDNYGLLKVGGNVKIEGEYSYFFGGTKKANFNNYGNIEVAGNLTMMEAAGTFKNEGNIVCNGELGVYNLGTIENKNHIITDSLVLYSYYKEPTPYQYSTLNMTDNAIIEISGDINIRDWTNENIIKGTLILNGKKQQKLQGLKVYNIEVQNPNGIQYLTDLEIYGNYCLNGNSLDNNGYKTTCYTGATFGDKSDYKDIYIAYKNTVTLNQSISGNFTGGENGVLVIPSDTEVVINGSVFLGWGKVINNGTLTVVDALRVSGKNSGITNNGRLFALSDFLLTKDSNNQYGNLEMSNATASLCVAGNFSLPYSSCSKISNGKVIFNGLQQQTITNLVAPTIILENASNEGVVFASSISPSILFNHNGNKYILYNNGQYSSFADYDGDGLNDNIDPYPTINCNKASFDVNCDDSVDIRDIVKLKMILENETEERPEVDVDGDGVFTYSDLIELRKSIFRYS